MTVDCLPFEVELHRRQTAVTSLLVVFKSASIHCGSDHILVATLLQVGGGGGGAAGNIDSSDSTVSICWYIYCVYSTVHIPVLLR